MEVAHLAPQVVEGDSLPVTGEFAKQEHVRFTALVSVPVLGMVVEADGATFCGGAD